MPNAFPPEAQKITDARTLFEAAADGDADAVAALLAAGADVSARREDGFTPLILAVFFGHEEVVRTLLERGADPTARTNLGTKAARWAAARGFQRMAALLRDAEVAHASGQGAAVPAHVAPLPVVPAPLSAAASSYGAPVPAVEAQRVTEAEAVNARVLAAVSHASNVPSSSTSWASPAPSNAPASNVSVRSDGRVPAHPSKSAFRLGHFLRSWQGSIGVALLLLAFAVTVFALLRGGGPPRVSSQPTPAPAPSAPQAAAQTHAQSLPTPQPSPASQTEPGQMVVPVTDPAYAVPNTAGQPFYVPSAPAAVVPVPSNGSRDLMVVSENGGAPAEEAAGQKRRNDANANVPSPAPAQGLSRDGQDAVSDPRSVRSTRPADPEQRPTQPAPPAPAPQPTPGRAKVIQWPPQ